MRCILASLFRWPISLYHYKYLLLQFVHVDESAVNQEQSQSQSELAAKVLDAADLGMFDWDISVNKVRLNQKALSIFGHTRAKVGQTYEQLLQTVHPDDENMVRESIEEHLETDWPLKVEFRIINELNQHVWVELKAQAEWQDEVPVRMVGSLEDISERKHVQLQLLQRETLIEQMIDALPISIYVKDAQGCYRFFNTEAEQVSNLTRNKLIGRTDFEVYKLPLSLKKAEADKQIQKSEDVSIFEGESDDKSRWMLNGKVPITVYQPDRADEIWLLSFALDITKRKQMEEDLKQARVVAEEAAKAKANFLSIMSHEIRTPLNSVIGNASLLLSENIDGDMSSQVEMIKRSGEHLLYLINDILDFNKLEAGKVELDKTPFDLQKQVHTVIEMSKTNAVMKGIYLQSDFESGLSQSYIGDEGRIRQVLLNLVGNAIKFTSEGGVSVKVFKVNESDNIRFEVVDTGIGISQENIPKLFSEFTQAEASTSKNFGGTGLGLAICKKLVEAMQGKIGIISEEGQGSIFWFEVPFEEALEQDSSTENETFDEVEALSILVAEDNLPNQFIIKAVLTKLGHEVTIANNGLEALQAIKGGEKHFDIVLMDMQMPEMDGLQATVQIRQDSSTPNPSIPIIALTANSCEDVTKTIQQHQLDDCLTKPLNIDRLKQVLNKWGQKRQPDKRVG